MFESINMKLVFVLLPFAAVLYAVAENEKCFKYGLTSADCISGEAKIQHLRADSGPPGKDGEKVSEVVEILHFA